MTFTRSLSYWNPRVFVFTPVLLTTKQKTLMSSTDQVSSLIWSSGNIKRWAGSPLWVHKFPISTQEHSLDESTAVHPPGRSLVPAPSMERLISSSCAGPEFRMGSSVFVSFKETYISSRTAQWKCLLQPKEAVPLFCRTVGGGQRYHNIKADTEVIKGNVACRNRIVMQLWTSSSSYE